MLNNYDTCTAIYSMMLKYFVVKYKGGIWTPVQPKNGKSEKECTIYN